MRWMLLVLAMGGCVHEGDLASWRGVPTRELLVHPLFSTLPRTVQPVGGGEELWTYSNCGSAPVVCSPAFGNVVCTGGGAMCCHNQFMVRGDTVEGYRVAGRCRTNCSVRPGGSCDAGPITAAGR